MVPIIEGTVDFIVPAAGKLCKTWYKVYGTLTSSTRPLICLNGGPGCPYFYLEPIGALAGEESFPVIFYDQLGSGNSTRLPEKAGAEDFWMPQLFLDELDNLVAKLSIPEYDLLGQSWGGMLGVSWSSLIRVWEMLCS
jgi:pimeloyl-ACP methyl ester carboxylesterase